MFLQRGLAAVSAADSTGKLKRFLGVAVLALFGPLLVIAVFLLLGHYTLVAPLTNVDGLVTGELRTWPLWTLLIVGILAILFIDINQSSLHPFYRWKLSDAFVIRRGKSNGEEKVEPNEELLLSDMRSVNVAGPYHLINASLNGPGSTSGSFVVVDGECDPKMQCGALVQAQRFAKLDFNVDIDIDLSRFHMTEDGASTFHFALGEIDYHLATDEAKNPRGQLLYIKLSRTGNEPPGVEHYRQLNEHFPHQSTADQFFDEYQFEAYRSLGEHATADVFSAEIHAVQPSSLRVLFSNLAKALRDPNYL